MTAALIFIVFIVSLCVFQIALSLGAPLGHFAWGGKHRVLPKKLRVSSALSIIIYLGMALAIASKASLIELLPQGTYLTALSWGIFAYLTLGVFMNAISRSKSERYTMTPVALILALCSLVVALQ